MKYFLPILILTCISIKAQEFKFKAVSKADLQEQYHPLDSTAPAATLYEKGYLTFKYEDGWKYNLEVTKRVKIYNSEGYDYATVKLPYYYADAIVNRENIKNLKAYVYNLEGKKIINENLRKKDFIDEDISGLWKQIKFTFPNLKPGSIIEYTYNYESPIIDKLPEWKFQDEIPVNHSVYELVIPEYFVYNERSKGYHPIQKDVENTTIDISFIMEAQGPNNYGSSSSLGTAIGTSRPRAIKYKYHAQNVPKLKDEPFVNNLDNFFTSIQHEISIFKNPGNNTVKQYTTNWKNVGLRLQKSSSFGEQLDDTNYYEEDVDNILNQSTIADDKIMKIFNYVKSHMKWNDHLGIYTSDKLRKVYKNRTGNIADINLMLVSMLRYAGFNAHPVLVSTISNGIPSSIASTAHYNYIICAVEFPNDKNLLLDASNPYTAPNLLPTRCLNWHGRLVRPNGTSEQMELNPKTLSKDNFIMNIKIKENGSITGKMRRQYTEQYAFKYRTTFNNTDRNEYINKMENNLGITINDYKSQNIKDLSKPIIETFSFEKEDAVDIINGDIYFSPLLFLAQKENPFKLNQKERKLPINFTFPKSKKYIINVDVPEGYKIDYIPKPIAIALPNQKGSYRFNIQKTPTGDLQIFVNQDLNAYILSADYYQPLKDYFKTIVNTETDKIVLVKI